MTLPFRHRPKSKFQQLLDITIKVPGIIADAYQTLKAPMEGLVAFDPSNILLFMLSLINRCWELDSELNEFYTNLERETLGPVYCPELSAGIEGMCTEGELDTHSISSRVQILRCSHGPYLSDVLYVFSQRFFPSHHKDCSRS
jgi:hypothetical protein